MNSMRMISNKNNNNKIKNKMIINGYHGFNYERIKRFISYYLRLWIWMMVRSKKVVRLLKLLGIY